MLFRSEEDRAEAVCRFCDTEFVGTDGTGQMYNINAEFASPVGSRSIGQRAKSAVFAALADVVLVSGPMTGEEVELGNLKEAKKAVPGTPVFANTGVNIDNVGNILAEGDGAIVVNEIGCDPAALSHTHANAYFGHPIAAGLGWGIGAALGAEKLILCTGAPGILERVEDPTSVISYTDLAGLKRLRDEKRIVDGMLPKAKAIESAIQGGVKRVHVISYKASDAILAEVFTNEGTGTLVVADIGKLAPAELAAGDAARS